MQDEGFPVEELIELNRLAEGVSPRRSELLEARKALFAHKYGGDGASFWTTNFQTADENRTQVETRLLERWKASKRDVNGKKLMMDWNNVLTAYVDEQSFDNDGVAKALNGVEAAGEYKRARIGGGTYNMAEEMCSVFEAES